MKIFALSDQHGFLPPVPECDLLIVAGDNCPDFPRGAKARLGSGPQIDNQESWFDAAWMDWRRNGIFGTNVVATWGNHDYLGERMHMPMVAPAPRRDGMVPSPDRRVRLAEDNLIPKREIDEHTVMVVDGLYEICNYGIWLTPWSSQFMDWAWMAEDDELDARYDLIPTGIDILVSHQPMRGHCDEGGLSITTGQVEHLGSLALMRAVARVKPRVLICGHIHGGHRRSKFNDTEIYNVSVVDEQYKLVRQPVEIFL